MPKFLSLLSAVFLFSACSSSSEESFVGKEYTLQNTPEQVEITLGFDGAESRFYGNAAVNNYFGTYTLDAQKLTFGPAGATMMAGPEPLMDAEREYLQFLPTVTTYKLEGKELTLQSKDGKELKFIEKLKDKQK